MRWPSLTQAPKKPKRFTACAGSFSTFHFARSLDRASPLLSALFATCVCCRVCCRVCCLCWQEFELRTFRVAFSCEHSGDGDCRAFNTRNKPFVRRCGTGSCVLHFGAAILVPMMLAKMPDELGYSTSRVMVWHIGKNSSNWPPLMAFPRQAMASSNRAEGMVKRW